MSGRAEPRRNEDSPFPRYAIMSVTGVAALVAALGGWALWLPDRPLWWTPLAVVLGSAAGGVLCAALLVLPALRDEPAPPRAPRPPPAPDGGHVGRRPTDAGPRSGQEPAAERPTQVLLPVERPAGAQATGQWWGRGAPPPAAGASGGEPAASERPAQRDLTQVAAAPRVVQCPRCGAFRVDVGHTSTGYAFRCRVDDHEWRWRPGTAWPATVVASRRRRAP